MWKVLALAIGVSMAAGQAAAQTKPASYPLGPELKVGVLYHDAGIFGGMKEEGVDFNAEYLFGGLRGSVFDAIWSPRPHIGLTVNSSGYTSQLYAGLTWQWNFYGPWFAAASFGLSAHTGKTESNSPDRKELGSPVLFRESVEIGVRILPDHSLSVFLDHISNARLADHNEGMETMGLRYGYRF